MLHKDEIKILRIVKLAPILVAVFSFIAIYVLYENNQLHFTHQVEKLKIESLNEREQLIKSEVMRVYDFIESEKKLASEKIKFTLKSRVQEAHAIAMSIYKNNQHREPDEIKALISDALRDIRFNQGRGYFFVYETNGTSVMHPISPQLQNTNLWNFQDVKGRYVIQELSHIAKKTGEGVLTWWWKKPSDTETEYEKIGYSKYFAPFDWFIGTGDYISDYEEELKKELLAVINKISYGDEGYIFIIDYKGLYLSHVKNSYIGQNRIEYRDVNDVAITQEIISVAKSGEGFLSYVGSIKPSTGMASPKRSFVKGLDDWQWAIGSGAYLNDIEELVLREKSELNERNNKELIQGLIVGAVMSITLFFITLFFSHLMKQRFQKYQQKVTQKTLELQDFNINLEQLVFSRTTELEESNEHLASAIAHLKSTQSKLLESEKMASMAGLVAGMAHELNTPLGIMLTSTSQVEKEMNYLFCQLGKQKLTRKDLQRVEQSWVLGYQLLNNNLQRSIQLVQSFKSLSMHNDIDDFQIFSVKSLFDSLADSFKDQFKKLGVQLIVDVDPRIIVNSYQWVLGQVFTQLIKNSLTHGFSEIRHPCIDICIRLQKENEQLLIDYFDNGCGSENRDKIFEPFYTTKRGSECTGLGLSIVYNQVSYKLLGSITCHSGRQQGLAFHVEVPVKIPGSGK